MSNRALIAIAALATVLGCTPGPSSGESKDVVRAYGVHHGEPAFRKLFEAFEQKTGTRVKPTFACRGHNLVDLAVEGGDGDICITDSAANVAELKEKGLSRAPAMRFGEITPVLLVQKGNPKGITSLKDLAKPGVRVALCFSRGCLGRVSDKILAKAELTDRVAPNIVKRVRGEMATAKAVDGTTADVAIMWSWVLPILGSEQYDTIPIPQDVNVIDPVVAVLLTTGKNRADAEALVDFLQTDAAQEILAEAKLAGGK